MRNLVSILGLGEPRLGLRPGSLRVWPWLLALAATGCAHPERSAGDQSAFLLPSRPPPRRETQTALGRQPPRRVSLEPLVDRRPPVLRQAGSLQGTDLVGKGPAAPVEMRTSAAEYLGQALKTEFTRQGHKWVAEAAKAEVALSGALLHYWVEANVKPFVVTWRAHVELELSARPVGVEPPPRPKAYVGSATGSYAPEMTPDPEARAFARRLLDEALDQLLTRLANDSEITQAFSFAPGRN